MTSVLRMPGVQNNRLVLDPLAKLVSYGIQNCATLKFVQLAGVCHYCNRGFTKERDKQLITRCVRTKQTTQPTREPEIKLTKSDPTDNGTLDVLPERPNRQWNP